MTQLSPKKKFVISALGTSLILGVGLWGFWRMSHRVARADIVLAEIQGKIDGLFEERRQSRTLEAILVKYRDDIRRIEEVFVDRARPVAFIEAIEELASKTGNAIAIEVNEPGSEKRALSFRITLEGERDNLLTYIRLLENLPYKIETTEMFFQKDVADFASVPKPRPPARLLLSFLVRTK